MDLIITLFFEKRRTKETFERRNLNHFPVFNIHEPANYYQQLLGRQDDAKRAFAATRSGPVEGNLVREKSGEERRGLQSAAPQAEEGLLVHERWKDRASTWHDHDDHADLGVTLRQTSSLRFPQQHDHQSAVHE